MPTSYSLGKSRATVELTLPSKNPETGERNICKVLRPDPQILINAGILDDFDSLTGLVAQKIQTIEGKSKITPEGLKDLAAQTDQMLKGLELMDRLVEAVVVAPKVVWAAVRDVSGQVVRDDRGNAKILDPSVRDEDVLYTDDVDLEDRMFILQFAVGGVKDFQQFRREQQELVGDVAAGESLPLSSL